MLAAADGSMVVSDSDQNNVEVLSHPLVIGCLLGWLLNDWVLKDTFGNAITGKLSDVFAMVVFPLLVAVLIRPVVARPMAWAVAITGLFFSAINVLDSADQITETGLNLLLPSALTKDPTDLIVLPVMYVAVLIWNQPRRDTGSLRRYVGRAVLVAGVITTTATSQADEPQTEELSGTLLLTAESPQFSMALEYLIEGERLDPDLEVLLDIVAFGEGPPGSDGAPHDVVSWEADQNQIVYRMTDTSWAPIEVSWRVSGFGANNTPATLTIDAPADEFGPKPDAILRLPEGSDGRWTTAEAIVRFDPARPPRATFMDGQSTSMATAESLLFAGGSRNVPIRPVTGCGDPCELSLWVSYKSSASAPAYGLYGDVQIIEVRTHKLVEVSAAQLSTNVPAGVKDERWTFCLQADVSITNPIEQITTFVSFDETWDEDVSWQRDAPQQVSAVGDHCLAEEHVRVNWNDDRFEQLRLDASVWTLSDRAPTEALLVQTEP